MIRAALILVVMAMAGCGVDGPRVAPDGAVQPIAESGVGLIPNKGNI